jgi:hypothetical protein
LRGCAVVWHVEALPGDVAIVAVCGRFL